MALGRVLVVSLVLVLGAAAHATAGVSMVSLGGQVYIDAVSLAAHMNAKLERTPERLYLRSRGHVVTLTRGWARVEVDGKAVVLDAPVRVEQERWLVPEAFSRQVLPMLGARAAAPGSSAPPRAASAAQPGGTPARVAPAPASSSAAPADRSRAPAPTAPAIEPPRVAAPVPSLAERPRAGVPAAAVVEQPRVVAPAVPPAASAVEQPRVAMPVPEQPRVAAPGAPVEQPRVAVPAPPARGPSLAGPVLEPARPTASPAMAMEAPRPGPPPARAMEPPRPTAPVTSGITASAGPAAAASTLPAPAAAAPAAIAPAPVAPATAPMPVVIPPRVTVVPAPVISATPAVPPAPVATAAPPSVAPAAPAPVEAQRGGPAATPRPEVATAAVPRVRVIEAGGNPAPPKAVAALPAVKDAAVAATLEDLRLRSYPTFTRVVVETSALVRYRVEAVTPKEVRIRLSSVSVGRRSEEIRDGLLEDVLLEPTDGDAVLRVTFAGASQEPKVSALSDPPRLLFDFGRAPEPGPRGQTLGAPGPLRTIVLDAGHGGHDSGAVGPAGLMEKDLVLDVTRRVAALVEARLPGIKVLLSRKSDYFVPLRERTSYANRERADLFVSIHANAHREAASEGVETYFLSSEATDNAARQVAAAENSVVKLERPTVRGARADVVKAILWDLAQSGFQQESSRLAEVVQDSMTQSLRIPNRGVKQAGFYVLGGAAMPAVLVEIGFVTNPKEERKLKESSYRDEIAQAIFAGIAEYRHDVERRASRAAARQP